MEIELKSPCDDVSALRHKLIELNAVSSKKQHQVDVYYTHPCRDLGVSDEALRIRHQNGDAILHYKGPRLDASTKTREELGILLPEDDSMGLILERLGFLPRYEVRKQRESFILDDCEVSLDLVDDLGHYIEIEYLGKDDQGEKAVNDLATRLGLKGNEKRSYLELLHFPEGVDG